ATDNVFTITDTNEGRLNGQAFVDVENLSGGALSDTFDFRRWGMVLGRIDGAIDGGDGVDTLSYASRTGTNVVNLTTGSALGVLGGVGQIENVLGSQGIDILTGNGEDNILVGNGGNDTLDGGDGTDTFIGGLDTDTLVAEATVNLFTITNLNSGTLNGQS